MEQDNSDLLPHYYPFWNHWWYIIECFLEKQNLWRIVWYTPSVLSMTELTVWHIIIIIIIFINHYTVCTIHFDSCSRKESFLINWIHHSDLRRGHLVSSFIDILMRDAGVASTIKHSACMDNRGGLGGQATSSAEATWMNDYYNWWNMILLSTYLEDWEHHSRENHPQNRHHHHCHLTIAHESNVFHLHPQLWLWQDEPGH